MLAATACSSTPSTTRSRNAAPECRSAAPRPSRRNTGTKLILSTGTDPPGQDLPGSWEARGSRPAARPGRSRLAPCGRRRAVVGRPAGRRQATEYADRLRLRAAPCVAEGARRMAGGCCLWQAACSPFAHRRCAYARTSQHTAMVNVPVRRTVVDADRLPGTGRWGSNPGIPTIATPQPSTAGVLLCRRGDVPRHDPRPKGWGLSLAPQPTRPRPRP